ncbi:unnamed protein product [Clonostachys rhizophaga]|uniref:Glycerate-and formate-dehydrogenase n=1 Tax=Clonostachys rhizophaga TaxID=160324 RepID=A0A9N9V8C3_9HYPO|nr:unnamed protein product [Clonostachys rhizophaga]
MSTSQSGQKPLIVCLGSTKYLDNAYLDKFQEHFNYKVLDAQDRAETIEKLPALIKEHGPVEGFIIRMGTPPYEPFDAELLQSLAPGCRIITSASAGYNEFDVKWMAENGIQFCNSVDAVAEATADMAIFLLLSVLKNATNAERSARAGQWKKNLVPTRDPTNLTVGIVGMGSIGKYFAKKAAVFNLKIKYYNRNRLSVNDETLYNATYCSSLHELLGCSDIVSLHCPLNAETTNLISEPEFAAMKDGAFLINTARGAVIKESALKEALKSGKVARAGLDVFVNEPSPDPWFFEENNNVTIQPHLGGLTDVAFYKAEKECFENISALFLRGKANSPVNLHLMKQ